MSEAATFPVATVALGPASSRPGNDPTTATDEGVLLRLALWPAEVAAEAALAATRPEAGPTGGLDTLPLPGGAEASPVAEPTS